MRVALVHDWLLAMRGGERCLEVIRSLYPNSEVFTLLAVPSELSEQLRIAPRHTSFISKLPGVRRYYRYLLPLFPLAAFELSQRLAAAHRREPFDLVISVSHCAAKNVRAPKGVPHLCYCLTPVRYLWDQYERYFKDRLYEPIVRALAIPLRGWDRRGAGHVDRFVAISRFVAQRVERYYQRDASVVFPAIDTSLFCPSEGSERERGYFLCVNALVPYKNTHIVVEAFSSLPYRLIVVGQGPEAARVKRLAGKNVEFQEKLKLTDLRSLYRGAAALVFAAEEDFGMTPVEIQACGRPVIAFAKGGVLETVVANKTGLFFKRCTPEAIAAAVKEFMSRQQDYTVDNCLSQAQKFSIRTFVEGFEREVQALLNAHATSAQELRAAARRRSSQGVD